uniref:NADH-ubiquinone oxidoreductase chain 5 n=1 Tax=Macrocheles nataliae TaxID=2058476 RepID=A0A6B9WES4_9ACAR|nr:NADH dehydrogenase subunit 5 [Macrocheles nataliae]
MMFQVWSIYLFILFLFFLFLSFYMILYNGIFILEFVLFYLKSLDVSFFMFFDWMSCLFLSIVMLISSMVLYYSEEYMKHDYNQNLFLILVLLFVLSMMLMVISLNMWMIMLGWDGLGLVSYCLVVYYQNESSQYAGMLTVLINRLGDIGMILSLIFFMNFLSWSFIDYLNNMKFYNYIILFLMLGALTKSAQMPFSSWLPAAMAAPTPVSALVHSSTLVTAGVYLMIRFSKYFEGGEFSSILLYISILTMFMSGMVAIFEMDLKKIIALSTLSQLGIMMMILSLGEESMAYFHLISHAIFKAMLFLCAGVVIHCMGGYQDIRKLPILQNVSPFIMGCMFLSSLSLMGFPFLSGFYSKDLILEFMYYHNNNMIIIMMIMLSVMMTVIYSLRMMYFCSWKSQVSMVFFSKMESKNFNFSILILSYFVIFLGSMFMWIFYKNPMVIILKLNIKILNFFMVMLSFFYLYIYFNKSYMKMDFMKNYIFSMWFLSIISSKSVMLLGEFMNKNLKLVESGWVEELTSQGMYKSVNSMKKIFLLNLITVKNVMLLLFMMMMFY